MGFIDSLKKLAGRLSYIKNPSIRYFSLICLILQAIWIAPLATCLSVRTIERLTGNTNTFPH